MGLRIHTNVPSLIGQRNLRTTRGNLDRTFERLSSGKRINHASDDAAGLAISEILTAQMRGLAQAERNAQDGVSVIQVAEGGLSEISNIIIRMRELGVQAASDTVGQNERKFIDIEYQQLIQEIDRIARTTEFNRVPLLNGSAAAFDIQIGTGNNPSVDRIRLFDVDSGTVDSVSLGLNLSSLEDKVSAQNSLAAIDTALDSVTATRAHFGALQNRLHSIISNHAVSRENLASATSRIKDMDAAEEMSELTKNQILMQTGISVLSQANSTIKTALGLLNQGN